MKTAVIYYSKHHGNTKKLIDAFADDTCTLIDAAGGCAADLSEYDLIGFASGIYWSTFHKSVLNIAREKLPEGKNVFFVCTYGAQKNSYTKAIKSIAEKKHCRILGEYGALGYDTYGPFKIVGGIAKGHPDDTEIAGAREFFRNISEKL